ncbi:hypothetical protein MBLNU13_g09679t1 [Cladosporium sp. NU13]
MISAQDWKTANLVRCEDADGIDADHVAAVEALASLLEGDMTPADAAQCITTTYAASVKVAEGPFKANSWKINKVYKFWRVFMSNAIRSFGSAEDQERLFKLLVEISRQPDLEDDDGIVIGDLYLDPYWIDLPAYTIHPENKEMLLSMGQPLLNATRFAAMLLSKNEFASARVGGGEWEVLLPVATTWLLISGKAIYEHCLEESLYDGWETDTWDLQRWNLWKQQLEQFAERDDFNAECRSLTSQTVKKMVEVEVEHRAEPPSSETWCPVDAMEHELKSSNFPVD